MSTTKTNMLLRDMKLRNFKGIRSFDLELNENSAVVYGANESGKTTLNDALTYLLFDKDTQNRGPLKFGIKTLVDGQVLNGVEHTVEATFCNVKLKKIYKENYTKKRGTNKENFTGHTVDYFIDDVPKGSGEYKGEVEKIVSEEVFKMLTIPNYFAEIMHWTDRRAMLVMLAGDYSVEEIIANKIELQRYPEILDGKTEDDRVTILKGLKKEYKKEIKGIPERIDENTLLLKDVEGFEEAEKQIELLTERQSKIKGKIQQVKDGGIVAELRNQITELEGKQIALKNNHASNQSNEFEELEKKKAELRTELSKVTNQANDLANDLSNVKFKQSVSAKKLEGIKEGLKKLRESKPNEDVGEELCAMCGQPTEAEQSYEEYVEGFNAKKATEIKADEGLVADIEADIVSLQSEIDRITKEGKELEARESELKKEIAGIQETINNQQRSITPVVETEEYKAIDVEISTIKKKIENESEEQSGRIKTLQDEVDKIQAEIDAHKEIIDNKKLNDQYNQRIVELREEIDSYTDKLEEVENDLFIIEKFVRARSEYITGVVNTKFDGVEFRMFKEQVNGGVDECCDVLGKNGVAYSEGMNNAQRIQIGVRIIDTLSKHFGISLPLFIDNRESVTKLPENDLQTISLVVSPEDKKLRVELEQEEAVLA
ncbi:MAG: AAA family ATPase [Balneola sp.]